MPYGEIDLSPSRTYQVKYKNGRINFAGSIRKIVKDLPEGEVFGSGSMAVFTRECGLQGNVVSTLNNLSNESFLKKEFAGYYRRTRDKGE